MTHRRKTLTDNAQTIALTVGGDAPVKCAKSYIKDIMRVGDFVGQEGNFSVTPDLLSYWCSTFHKMKQKGIKIPVPLGHTEDEEKNRGFVDDMWVDGEKLYGRLTLSDDTLADTQDVSIYAPKDFVDGEGESWKWPVAHVALTPRPLVPALGDFVEIAASRVPVYRSDIMPEEKEVVETPETPAEEEAPATPQNHALHLLEKAGVLTPEQVTALEAIDGDVETMMAVLDIVLDKPQTAIEASRPRTGAQVFRVEHAGSKTSFVDFVNKKYTKEI